MAAVFSPFPSCNAICANPAATATDIANCTSLADGFDNGGQAIPSPFDQDQCSTALCDAAAHAGCTIVAPSHGAYCNGSPCLQ